MYITRPLHSFLSWAIFFTSPQIFSLLFTPSSRIRLQVGRGLPLFLFSCGFQSRAFFGMLLFSLRSVCPTHLNLLFPISYSAKSLASFSPYFLVGNLVRPSFPKNIQESDGEDFYSHGVCMFHRGSLSQVLTETVEHVYKASRQFVIRHTISW